MSVIANFRKQAKSMFAFAGYDESNLVYDYIYSHPVSMEGFTTESADLVAFSGKPHTFRTACIIATDLTLERVEDSSVRGLDYLQERAIRFLGAPLALVNQENEVVLYSVTRDELKRVDAYRGDEWTIAFNSRLSDLSPSNIEAAKSGDRQLTFIEAGLADWVEEATGQTLVRLLESLFRQSLSLLKKTSRAETAIAEKAIIRLVCHLFACRVLEDKGVVESSDTANKCLRAASNRYPDHFDLSVLKSPFFQQEDVETIYRRLKSEFAFGSLTTDMLGRAYENAMVTPSLRKELGIYYTPRIITQYVLNTLPIESIPEKSRLLCDPCCGSGSFLLAGFDRLGSIVDERKPTSQQRHAYLRTHLIGSDIDEFACEVARLSLILADPFNEDGWTVFPKDVREVTPKDFGKRPTIIVTNPKFQEIKEHGTRREFAAEALTKIIDLLPNGGLLGIVLPQSFLDSGACATARTKVLKECSLLEITLLPGGIFFSGAETVVLMLKKGRDDDQRDGRLVMVRELRSVDLALFKTRRSFTRSYLVNYAKWEEDDESQFVVSPLIGIFTRVSTYCEPLSDFAEIHNGLRVKVADSTSVVDKKDATHNKRYVDRLDVLRPFALLTKGSIRPIRWLAYGPHLDRKRDEKIFTSEKVLISANRNPGSSWRLVAASDKTGLFFSDNFHGIIPLKDMTSVDELVAVLNSPFANAWFDASCRKRKVVQATLRSLPFPNFHHGNRPILKELVKRLETTLLSHFRQQDDGMFYSGITGTTGSVDDLLERIDEIVFNAYGLSMDERAQVAQVMSLEKRPI